MKLTKKHLIFPALFLIVIPSWFAIQNFLPAGEIYLDHHDNQQTHIVSVNARNLRYPFFGTAFHLNYNPNEYIYDHFTLGDYFSPEDSPLTLVHESVKGTVVAGISLKRGEIIKKSEGTLLNFYFRKRSSQNNTNDFLFSNAVFSTFENERRDIDNIIFNSH